MNPISEARTKIGCEIESCNEGRPRGSQKVQTPDQAYFRRSPEAMAAWLRARPAVEMPV
jgi:hypothetical protein